MYKVLVTGANGQLGNELKRLSVAFPEFQFLWTDILELDITSSGMVRKLLQENRQDLIINCAAYTAVDKAESDSETAFRINEAAVKILAESAREYNAGFLHVSTDFVFEGNTHVPYRESDETNPLSVYGKSKLGGEAPALEAGIVLRTSWLYSVFGNNFLKTILRLAKEKKELGVIFDQTGTPTLAADLAQAILSIVKKSHRETIPEE
jgi:dTDP-4-dehydrorhamnose reductase